MVVTGADGGEAEEVLVRPLSDHERLAEFMRRLSAAAASRQVRRRRTTIACSGQRDRRASCIHRQSDAAP